MEINLLIDRNTRLFPLKSKAIATLLPRPAKVLNKWHELAGEKAAKGIIIANINDPVEVGGCRSILWKYAL